MISEATVTRKAWTAGVYDLHGTVHTYLHQVDVVVDLGSMTLVVINGEHTTLRSECVHATRGQALASIIEGLVGRREKLDSMIEARRQEFAAWAEETAA